MNKPALTAILAVPILILVVLLLLGSKKTTKQKESEFAKSQSSAQSALKSQQTAQPPEMQIDKTKKYTAALNTSEGKIVLELTADKTPITVNNFVALSKKSFYNGTAFHRVIKDFMVQGGDPLGNGLGGPGYIFDDEPITGEYTAGTIAMANAGPNTNGSQFFIMHKDYALPKQYVIFGKVIEGMDVVDKIALAPVTKTSIMDREENSVPLNPVRIQSIDILEK